MKKTFIINLLARLAVLVALLQLPGIIHAQSYKLFGISGEQQSEQLAPGVYDHKDHTLFSIDTSTGLLTDVIRMTWVIDSQALSYCPVNGLLYHSAGSEAYRNGQNTVHDQDSNEQTPGGAYQDNQYMENYNLLTGTLTGVYNANPCPNPDNPANEPNLPPEEQDGLYLPCFGLPAPIPPWVEPQYRRNTTQTDSTNRISGPNEVASIRGFAWSTADNAWYVSNGDLFKMSLDGMTCTKIGTPVFQIPTDDLDTYTNGYRPIADLKALAFIKVGGQTKLFGTWRDDNGTISGNTNSWLMEIDPVTGTNLAQIAVHPPPGGSPVGNNGDEFGGILGLAQNPQTGVVYAIRKTEDAYARELVTIDLATGNSTLVGVLTDGTYGQAITTLAFVPDILVTSVNQSGSTLNVTWTGAAKQTFSLQTASSAAGPWTTLSSGLSGPSASASITNSLGLFRISKP
jgi:hypothetical protein